jgi:WD40 repeat protein
VHPFLTFYRSSKNKDQLIKTFEEHEDSVYSIAWGTSGWSFASLSYDGRVVINDVPKEYSDFF